MVRTQQILKDSKYLGSSRIQLEAIVGKCNAKWAGNGFRCKGKGQRCRNITGLVAEWVGFEPTVPEGTTDFEGRETAKTPYISAQVRIKYLP